MKEPDPMAFSNEMIPQFYSKIFRVDGRSFDIREDSLKAIEFYSS